MKENQKEQVGQKSQATPTKGQNQAYQQNGQTKTPVKQDKDRTGKNDDQDEYDEEETTFNNESDRQKKKYDKDDDREEEVDEQDPSIKGKKRPQGIENEQDTPRREREEPERRKEHEDYQHPHGTKMPTAPSTDQKTGSKTGNNVKGSR